MSTCRISIGTEFFRRLRENNGYYVDKTSFIEELLSGIPAEVSLFTRPRRFGKTLMMTMLRDFFDIRQDSKGIFEGLAISQNKALCERWMNQYPTVFITLKNVEGTSFRSAMVQMQDFLSSVTLEFPELMKSSSVPQEEKEKMQMLRSGQNTPEQMQNSLNILCRALHAHYDKPAILLIDEYDVPLARAEQAGYYEEMVSFLRNFLGSALKTNPSLQLGILTGCLRIARESIFTGLNNFACYSISDTEFADKFGFTEEEVDALLESGNLSYKKEELKEWYDGYLFGHGTEDNVQYFSQI